MKKTHVFLIGIFCLLAGIFGCSSICQAKKKNSTKMNYSSVVIKKHTKKIIKLTKYSKLSKKKIKKVKWKTSNKHVASVQGYGKYKQKGKIVANNVGTCRVTVKYNGILYRCKVKVVDSKKDYTKEYTSEDNNTSENDKKDLDNRVTEEKDWKDTIDEATNEENNEEENNAYTDFDSSNEKDHEQPEIKPRYNYKVFLVNGGYSMLSLDGRNIFYIRTDNPDPSNFDLEIVKNMGKPSEERAGSVYVCRNTMWHSLIDLEVEESDDGEYISYCKVKGGYLAFVGVNDGGMIGIKVLEKLSEHVSIIAEQKEFYILDYCDEYNKWMDEIIDKATTEDMNLHQKMKAICNYLNGMVTYRLNDGTYLVQTTDTFCLPKFVNKQLTSATTPMLLRDIGNRIGYDLVSMYSGEDWSMHFYVKGEFEGETHYYTLSNGVNPATGYIDINTIKKIDFNKFSIVFE